MQDSGSSDAAPNILGFVPSNIDLSALDLTGVGDFDATDPNCTLASDQLTASCGDATDLKYKLVTLPDSTKVGVYVAHSLRIESNAVLTDHREFSGRLRRSR